MLKCITFDCTNTLMRVNKGVAHQYGRILNDNFNYKLDEKLTNINFKKYFLEQNKQQPGYGFKIGNYFINFLKQIISLLKVLKQEFSEFI